MMKYHLTAYFNEERIYFALLEKGQKGFKAIDVNSTHHPFSFMNIEEPSNSDAKREIEEILSEYEPSEIEKISVALPTDNIFITQFPAHPDISVEELKNLVNFEIKNSYPQFSYDDFNSNVYELVPHNSKYMMIAVIISKKDLEQCSELLSILNKPINNIEISQFNAHNAYIYNYPDKHWNTVAFFNIGSSFIDFSIMLNKELFYYSIIATSSESTISQIIYDALNNAQIKYQIVIDAVNLFGSNLNKQIFEETRNLLMKTYTDCQRLNAFRMMESNLSNRKRDYCSRVAHIFPACIGGIFPSIHKKFKLY